MPVFLVAARASHAPDAPPADLGAIEGLFDDLAHLWPGLALVEADASQSRVYHDVKWSLPDGCGLVVAILEHQPQVQASSRGLSAGPSSGSASGGRRCPADRRPAACVKAGS